jgi:hypothetical protein
MAQPEETLGWFVDARITCARSAAEPSTPTGRASLKKALTKLC